MSRPIHITLLTSGNRLQVLTNMEQPRAGAPLTVEESAALGMLNLARGTGGQVQYGHHPATELVDDLLNPEALGFAVTAEVRDRARLVVGLMPVESYLRPAKAGAL